MATDIITTILRTLASMGTVFSAGDLATLRSVYLRSAQDVIRQYYADAVVNGLEFARHEEEAAVEAFAERISVASSAFLQAPVEADAMPNWARVIAALPDFPGRLREAVVADAQMSPVSTVARQPVAGA